MRIAFFHVGEKSDLATAMVASCKRHMPDIEVWQLTDWDTAAVPGVDQVRRSNPIGPMMAHRHRGYGALPDGEWLLLDTDVVVQEDVRHVMDDLLSAGGDVAMSYREWHVLQPWNAGVIFTRKPSFCTEVGVTLEGMSEPYLFTNEQIAIALVVVRGDYKVGKLDRQYNYSPDEEGEDVSGAAIVHYKGKRKDWMRRACGLL